jgi:hypothetical protein
MILMSADRLDFRCLSAVPQSGNGERGSTMNRHSSISRDPAFPLCIGWIVLFSVCRCIEGPSHAFRLERQPNRGVEPFDISRSMRTRPKPLRSGTSTGGPPRSRQLMRKRGTVECDKGLVLHDEDRAASKAGALHRASPSTAKRVCLRVSPT